MAAATQAKPQAATAAVLIDTPLQQPGGGQGGAQELSAGRRLLINDPLSSLASSGFYVVTTVTGEWWAPACTARECNQLAMFVCGTCSAPLVSLQLL